MVTKAYSSEVDGVKIYKFDCGRHTLNFNETQKDFLN